MQAAHVHIHLAGHAHTNRGLLLSEYAYMWPEITSTVDGLSSMHSCDEGGGRGD
jgi:hypothetical protein